MNALEGRVAFRQSVDTFVCQIDNFDETDPADLEEVGGELED
jgi:hypothetical protein